MTSLDCVLRQLPRATRLLLDPLFVRHPLSHYFLPPNSIVTLDHDDYGWRPSLLSSDLPNA